MTDFDVDLDAKGVSCPLPILRAKKSLSEMASGQVLRITATDKGSMNDFPEFCRQTGNVLLLAEARDGEFRFLIRRR
ncbi:MAG TPA: sulfurtransferase TusA family protein [Gallionella sp.]